MCAGLVVLLICRFSLVFAWMLGRYGCLCIFAVCMLLCVEVIDVCVVMSCVYEESYVSSVYVCV